MSDSGLSILDCLPPEFATAHSGCSVRHQIRPNAFEILLRAIILLARLVPVANLDTDIDADYDDHEINENRKPVFVDDVMPDPA